MSKKIVVKMRNLKKILGNEMLQLAIMLSLMRADPEFLLFPGGRPDSYGDDFGFGGLNELNEDVLIQNSFGDAGGFGGGGGFGGLGDFSPRLHPKSMDAVLERYQVGPGFKRQKIFER